MLGSLAVVCRHDINVPFIVAGPGIKPNTVVTHLAANYDLAPTWLELAGITGSYNPSEFAYSAGIGAPAGAQNLGIAGGPPFDGKSLVPLLHGIQDRGKIWYRTCTLNARSTTNHGLRAATPLTCPVVGRRHSARGWLHGSRRREDPSGGHGHGGVSSRGGYVRRRPGSV